jgi:hypothetical protein
MKVEIEGDEQRGTSITRNNVARLDLPLVLIIFCGTTVKINGQHVSCQIDSLQRGRRKGGTNKGEEANRSEQF